MKKFLIVLFLLVLTGCSKEETIVDKFEGLEPKATFGVYKIYDIVEQRNLPCAEALEFLDSDDTYDYYFNCLKSDQIYFVNEDEIIKVKNFYHAKLITLEKLYELKIVDRIEKE